MFEDRTVAETIPGAKKQLVRGSFWSPTYYKKFFFFCRNSRKNVE
jgi:hypothetical protein